MDSPVSANVTLIFQASRTHEPEDLLGCDFRSLVGWGAGEDQKRVSSSGPPTGPGDFLFERLFRWTMDQDSNRVLHGLDGSFLYRFIGGIG